MDNQTPCDRGDIGLAKAISDLSVRGYKIFVPLSAHLIVDLVVMNSDGMLCKLQVKYCKMHTHGRVHVKLCKTYTNTKGQRTTTCDRDAFDGFAVYSEATDKVYYISNRQIPNDAVELFSFRYTDEPSRCNRPVRYATEFEEPEVLFERN